MEEKPWEAEAPLKHNSLAFMLNPAGEERNTERWLTSRARRISDPKNVVMWLDVSTEPWYVAWTRSIVGADSALRKNDAMPIISIQVAAFPVANRRDIS